MTDQLTATDRAIIRAAVGPHRDAGAELEALTRASGQSLARTWQRLNQLLGEPAAWEVEPVALRILTERRQLRPRMRAR